MLPYPVYIWDGALGEWVDHGNLRGVGIQKIEQISSSTDSLGENVIRVTLDDGSFYDYTVRNGDRGPAGSIWIGTSAPPDDSYSIWLNPSGMVSGYVGANQGAENSGRVLAVGDDGVVIPREETPYTLPQASQDALGGIKADAAETADTQPVRIGMDGKLYTAPGGDTSIGITGASAGQIPKVKAVDASGAPTEWKAEKDTTPFIVTVGTASSGYTSSHTFDEIVAAASAGRVVMAYSDYIDFPQVGKSLYGVYFDLDSTQDVAVFVYIDPFNMIKYTFAVDPFSISASASYLSATSSTFGGVKADSAESTDTQPVRIGGDGKLYTAPGSGGGASEWTLFQEGITDADVSGFEFDGVGDYTEFLFLGSWVKGSGSAGLSVKMNDAYALTVGNYFVHNGQAKNVSVELILMERKRFSLRGLSQQQNSTQYNIDELGTQSIYNIPQGIETPITKISFYSSTTSVQIPAGATYALYVR